MEFLNDYIPPNLIYDSVRTETARKELLDNYSWANGVVQSGQKIIDRGEIVNKQTYNILESLRKESIKRSESIGQKRLILGGQILFVGILILCFMLYLELFRKDYYERKGSLSLLFALIVFYCVISGGNIDVNILSRVITRGLVMSGRKANLTIALEDKPGQLQRVAEIVSRCGSNVVSVLHDGSDPNMPISSCFLKLTLETRDAAQIEQIRAELTKEGFQLVSERV